MTSDESVRIATLTTGAIRESAKKVTEEIRAAVREAEQRTKDLATEADTLIEAFERRTGSLADDINAHIVMCQETIDRFKARQFPVNPVEPTVDEDDTPEEPRAPARRTALG